MNRNEILENIKVLEKQPNVDQVLFFDQKLDEFFYGDLKSSEAKIQEEQADAYAGLEVAALQTSYLDYFKILSDLKEEEVLTDLGAGYGRGTILSEYLELALCKSVEYVSERSCALKMALSVHGVAEESLAIEADLLRDKVPDTKAYYLYMPKNKTLDRIMQVLCEYAQIDARYLYVTESHGDCLGYLALFPNIKLVKTFATSLPRHHDKIHKFEISSLESEHFISWFFANREHGGVVIEKPQGWTVPLALCEVINYRNQLSLLYKGKRVIEIHRDERIIEQYSSLSSEFIELALKYEKVLNQSGIIQVEHSGNFLNINNLST